MMSLNSAIIKTYVFQHLIKSYGKIKNFKKIVLQKK